MYYVTWVLARIIGSLPSSFLDKTSHGLTWLLFDLLRVRRELILNNIQIAFPEMAVAERQRIGRASIYHFIATLFETIEGGPRNLIRDVQYVDRHHMDEAMAKGQGVFLVCVHMGNFEVLGASISQTWKALTVPVKYVGSGGFDRYVHSQRCRYGIDPVRRTTKGSGFMAIRKALDEGRPAGFMLDQARHGEPRLPLFGRPAKTNTSIAAIWKKCPVPMIPVYCQRRSFGSHEIHFLPELIPVQSVSGSDDVIAQSIEYNKVVEDIVRRCPEQYWWLHNRWK